MHILTACAKNVHRTILKFSFCFIKPMFKIWLIFMAQKR